MKVSAAGRAQIRQREGSRLDAYRDSIGVLTIGVGHTGRMAAPAVTPGMRITAEQCDAFLAADLAPVEAAINEAVKVALTQHEFDSCASLAFNIGTGGFRGSSVVRHLNAGDIPGAADAFLMWDKPAVLKQRREGERTEFLTPDGADKPAVRPSVVAHTAATVAAHPAAHPPAIAAEPAAVPQPGVLAFLAALFGLRTG